MGNPLRPFGIGSTLALENMKIISWNIAHSIEPWHVLAASDADVALLQEAGAPPEGLELEVDDLPWKTASGTSTRNWRTAIVRLSDRVKLRWRQPCPLTEADYRDLRVSLPGTLAVADAEDIASGEVVTLVSMYAPWEEPVSEASSSWIFADGSVHRLISDVSALVGRQAVQPIIATGDLNILRAYGERGSPYWARRYATVFERMEAIGMPFVGPRSPYGIQADPWPAELPRDSTTVPTFRPQRQDPTSAVRQLDFVFASTALHEQLRVRALNAPEEWGPSDHCRIFIDTIPCPFQENELPRA